MTKKSPPLRWLDNPIMWREFNRRLTGDIEYDCEIIRSFAEAAKIPLKRVLDKMKTHLHSGSSTMN